MAPTVRRGASVRTERLADLLPVRLVMTAETLAVGLVFAAVAYGPPYLECRRMKAAGEFYVGTTLRSCLGEKVSETNAGIDGFLQTTLRRSSAAREG